MAGDPGAQERWPSGLRRTTGNRVGVEAPRGFESPSLRQSPAKGLKPKTLHNFSNLHWPVWYTTWYARGMVTVPRTRLIQRNGTWYFRAKVPADLVDAFGKGEEKRSLATSNIHEARKRADVLSIQFDAKVEALRRKQHAQGGDKVRFSP